MARIRPPPAPEEDPQPPFEGPPGDCPVPARCRPQPYVARTLRRKGRKFANSATVATQAFKLLNKYRPETKPEKKERLTKEATAISEGKKKEDVSKKPYTTKFGLNHVVGLVENKKASLVLIANDVDPIELVVYLPALCRKMGVPYVIVKGKARLGTVVHQKTAAVVALTEVRAEDKNELSKLVSAVNDGYLESHHKDASRHWGGGIMGAKANARMEKRRKAIESAIKI
jgi:large subunit ribosomal protein L7Ae